VKGTRQELVPFAAVVALPLSSPHRIRTFQFRGQLPRCRSAI